MNKPAVIAVLRKDDRVLVIRRGPKVLSPGWWTLPGGRIEPGETEEAALVREMSEELGLRVTPLTKVWECDTDDRDFRLHWWLAGVAAGELDPDPDEVAENRWVTTAEFLELEPTFVGDRDFFLRVLPALQAEETMRSLGLDDEELAAWKAADLPQEAFVDWLTDRMARRPSGSRARQLYGSEEMHDFARRAILDALALGPGDRLLELGCGGGLLLRDAIAAGARATGLDHSPDMVEVAREIAPQAEVVLGEAERLPFADREFTAAAMSIVFLFFEDPVAVLRECRRVLRPGSRIAVYTTGPELRGTPAAPEPLASRGHFYTDDELVELATKAGLHDVHVENEGGGQLLTASA
jgi:8-oxo-dGTP diphosphatase